MEVAAAEQHVALPYTIVDVSTIPHDVEPEKLDTKPKAPSNPPAQPTTMPRRSKPTVNSSVGHNTTPSPAKRKDIGIKKNDDHQAKEDTKSTIDAASSVQKDDNKTAPMPTILYDDDHNRKDKVMSPNSQRKVAILIPSAPFPVSHIYEDIDDDDTNTLQQEKDAKEKVSISTKIIDTNKFDANMQAIAKNLDLKREKKSEPLCSSSQTQKDEAMNNEASDTRPDKSKKASGGGKGFLSRLFSKGGKGEEPEGDPGFNTSDKQISVVAKEKAWARSQSADCENTSKNSSAEDGMESPVNRVRKTVMRSESTKEQSALQSELKTILVKGVTNEESSSDSTAQNTKVKASPKGAVKDLEKINVTMKTTPKKIMEGAKTKGADVNLSKKPGIAGKPDKLKKPEKAKKPETPPCDKKISVVIDKPSAVVKPQISPPKPLSPVKPKPTRRVKSAVEEKTSDGGDRITLTCDTSDKFVVPESPISPG